MKGMQKVKRVIASLVSFNMLLSQVHIIKVIKSSLAGTDLPPVLDTTLS